jgi:hypothetical protein
MIRRIVTPNNEFKQEETFFTKAIRILRLGKMKRTTTEILIEVEETVRVRRGTNQSASDEEKLEAAMDTTVCPFCGGAFSPAENLENQNKSENQKEKE